MLFILYPRKAMTGRGDLLHSAACPERVPIVIFRALYAQTVHAPDCKAFPDGLSSSGSVLSIALVHCRVYRNKTMTCNRCKLLQTVLQLG